MPSNTTKVKVSDIEKVSKKLDAFMDKLPAQEQQVLGWILARAQAAGAATTSVKPVTPDRSRAALSSSVATAARPAVSSTLARAAGLGPGAAAGSEIGVTWKHSFGRISPATKVTKAASVTKATSVAKKTIR